jgi:hypothetical protein
MYSFENSINSFLIRRVNPVKILNPLKEKNVHDTAKTRELWLTSQILYGASLTCFREGSNMTQ